MVRLAALPYAALPIGTAVAMELGLSMVYPRKEVKAYGTARQIEGECQAGERAVVLDDLITTGGSKLAAIEPLEAAGLEVVALRTAFSVAVGEKDIAPLMGAARRIA